MKRPNLLYLHTHDSGRFLSPYGFDVPTPNLAKLAAEGVLYRDACCVSPTCSPSRAALLTGQAPHACGQLGLGNRGFPLQHPERLVVHPLKDAGYHTALLGVQHLVPDERDLGYEEVREALIGHTVTGDDAPIDAPVVADAACAWLEAHAHGDRPWFLDAGMVQTHTASWKLMADEQRPTPEEAEHAFPPPPLPPGPLGRQHWAHHRRSAAIADAAIGRILATLDRLGLGQNTLVVYTTDHGLGVPGSKCRLTEAGLATALILRGPAFRGGRVDNRPTDHLDVAPTLLEAAGTSAPWHAGRSLYAPDNPGRLRFSEINHHSVTQRPRPAVPLDPPLAAARRRRRSLPRQHRPHAGPCGAGNP